MCALRQVAIPPTEVFRKEVETDMADWVQPKYKQDDIDIAGALLADPIVNANDLEEALSVIDNWRAAHNFPLNTFQVTLRYKARHIDSHSLIAQRVKRLRAIRFKLQKHTKKPILLSQMQDIAGCRAVMNSVPMVKRLRDAYLNSELRHKLITPVDDYIERPRFSGYRGIHLVYTYYSEKQPTYNGFKVEVQLRTQLQHAWATSVEVVGFFRQELLKSSEGDYVWKHFFKLMANEIALREKSPLVPEMPTDWNVLREEIRRCEAKLGALNYLHTFGQGLQDVQEVDTVGAHFFLLELNAASRKLKVTGYRLSARQRASMDYAAVERAIFGSTQHSDAVLVAVESMAALRRAYTNYFLDMKRFIQVVEDTVGQNGKAEGKSPRPDKTAPAARR